MKHIKKLFIWAEKGERHPFTPFMGVERICRRISDGNAPKYIKKIIRKLFSKVILYTWLNMTDPNEKFRLKVKTKYEVSCTFIDKHQYIHKTKEPNNNHRCNNSPLLRLALFTNWLKTTYLPIWDNCNYEFYLELSDPQRLDKGKYARLHLHGIISFDTEEELFYWKLNTSYNLGKYGNIQLNKYRSNHWPKYIKKDYKKNVVMMGCLKPDIKFKYKSNRNEVNFTEEQTTQFFCEE